ncbi:hypothetical protein [Nocardiopsis ansamitocini]|nr:hypothetical protein [Nocardiopsis ansamitocini]
MESNQACDFLTGYDQDRLCQQAVRFETDALLFGEDRAELLGEAARFWHRAGQSRHALRLCTEAIAEGDGTGVGAARLRRMEILADQGRIPEFDQDVRALRGSELTESAACSAARLLESLGRAGEALEFYDRACTRPLAELAHFWPLDLARHVGILDALTGRSRLRAETGLPVDALDAKVAAFVSGPASFPTPSCRLPERNAPCGCGAPRRYKNCCGKRAIAADEHRRFARR